MTAALGIDIGTSGVRAAIVDAAKSIIAFEAQPYREGGSRDPRAWIDAARTCLARLDLTDVGAIAIDGTSGTLVAIDAYGEPLAAGSMYHDAASASACDQVARFSPAHASVTSPLARALDLRDRHHPAHILHQADFVALQLFDALFTDENNALKTGYDPVARHWSEAITALGLEGLLPPVHPVGAVAAMHEGRQIIAGTTDGCAAFLASGADALGDGVTSLGSTIVLKMLVDRPVSDAVTGVYSHRIGDLWLAGGASNSGGAVLAQFFTVPELEALTARLDPARPTGLDYYPLVSPGERFPVRDATLQPRLDPRPADDAVFLQAMLEAMSRIEAEGYRKLTAFSGRSLASLRTVGGGARNPVWTKLRADCIGVPVLSALSDHAAVGTALLALKAMP